MTMYPTFLIPDLVGFMVIAPIAMIFYIVYWKLGKRITDLLFANLTAINAAACLCALFIDSVVPPGISARAIPGAAETTLFWNRIFYLIGLFAMPTLLHFSLRYCRASNFSTRKVFLLYMVFMLATPAVWSDWLLHIRPEPIAYTSSWKCVYPWAPEHGPLTIVFAAVWLIVLSSVLWIVYRHRVHIKKYNRGALQYISLVFLAILLQCLTVLIDITICSQGYAGVSLVVCVTPIMCILLAIAIVKERIDTEHKQQYLHRELLLAKDIQDKLPPEKPPSISGFDLAGWIQSATYVGGDTYDLFPLPDGLLLATLGDASGHGMGPALVIAETRALARSAAHHHNRPSDILYDIDKLLSLDVELGRFVTFFVGLIDPDHALMTYSSAGHGPAFFYRQDTKKLIEQSSTSPPLGLFEISQKMALSTNDIELQFQSGDFLALFSDGVWEARNSHKEQFGISRIKQCLLNCRDMSAQEIINQVRSEVDNFVGSREQNDDMTIVVIRKI